MKGDIRQFARLGLVHHMLYPQSVYDPDYHKNTLETMIKRGDIETLDCCIPYGEGRRQPLYKAFEECEKERVYALHLFPAAKVSLASTVPYEQEITRMVVSDQIDVAAKIGVKGFIFVSGADSADRESAKAAFRDFCIWLCGKLKPHNIDALLEPMDREIDKKFLYGPTRECAELIKSLEGVVDNLKIELDAAHLPLLGESFEEGLKNTFPYLERVHIGNCVLKDKHHPLYGDKHPPIGFEGGEIGVEELADIFKNLLKYGYLNEADRGAVVVETIPFPGKDAEYTVEQTLMRIDEAWKRV